MKVNVEKKKKEINLFWMCAAIVAIVGIVGIVSMTKTTQKTGSDGVLVGEAAKVCRPSTTSSCSNSIQTDKITGANCVTKVVTTKCKCGCGLLTGKCKALVAARNVSSCSGNYWVNTNTNACGMRSITRYLCPFGCSTKTRQCNQRPVPPVTTTTVRPDGLYNEFKCFGLDSKQLRIVSGKETWVLYQGCTSYCDPATGKCPGGCVDSDNGISTKDGGICRINGRVDKPDSCSGETLIEYSCGMLNNGPVCSQNSINCKAVNFNYICKYDPSGLGYCG